jgi:phosphodiesterase/alkaline phosphatase D-like protein
MKLSRRRFLASSALAGAAFSVSPARSSAAAPKAPRKRIQLGISSYSYWHFKTEKVSI